MTSSSPEDWTGFLRAIDRWYGDLNRVASGGDSAHRQEIVLQPGGPDDYSPIPELPDDIADEWLHDTWNRPLYPNDYVFSLDDDGQFLGILYAYMHRHQDRYPFASDESSFTAHMRSEADGYEGGELRTWWLRYHEDVDAFKNAQNNEEREEAWNELVRREREGRGMHTEDGNERLEELWRPYLQHTYGSIDEWVPPQREQFREIDAVRESGRNEMNGIVYDMLNEHNVVDVEEFFETVRQYKEDNGHLPYGFFTVIDQYPELIDALSSEVNRDTVGEILGVPSDWLEMMPVGQTTETERPINYENSLRRYLDFEYKGDRTMYSREGIEFQAMYFMVYGDFYRLGTEDSPDLASHHMFNERELVFFANSGFDKLSKDTGKQGYEENVVFGEPVPIEDIVEEVEGDEPVGDWHVEGNADGIWQEVEQEGGSVIDFINEVYRFKEANGYLPYGAIKILADEGLDDIHLEVASRSLGVPAWWFWPDAQNHDVSRIQSRLDGMDMDKTFNSLEGKKFQAMYFYVNGEYYKPDDADNLEDYIPSDDWNMSLMHELADVGFMEADIGYDSLTQPTYYQQSREWSSDGSGDLETLIYNATGGESHPLNVRNFMKYVSEYQTVHGHLPFGLMGLVNDHWVIRKYLNNTENREEIADLWGVPPDFLETGGIQSRINEYEGDRSFASEEGKNFQSMYFYANGEFYVPEDAENMDDYTPPEDWTQFDMIDRANAGLEEHGYDPATSTPETGDPSTGATTGDDDPGASGGDTSGGHDVDGGHDRHSNPHFVDLTKTNMMC